MNPLPKKLVHWLMEPVQVPRIIGGGNDILFCCFVIVSLRSFLSKSPLPIRQFYFGPKLRIMSNYFLIECNLSHAILD